jgi:hypothetical protein
MAHIALCGDTSLDKLDHESPAFCIGRREKLRNENASGMLVSVS